MREEESSIPSTILILLMEVYFLQLKKTKKLLYRSRYRTKNQSKINLDLIQATNRQKYMQSSQNQDEKSIILLPAHYGTNKNYHKKEVGNKQKY